MEERLVLEQGLRFCWGAVGSSLYSPCGLVGVLRCGVSASGCLGIRLDGHGVGVGPGGVVGNVLIVKAFVDRHQVLGRFLFLVAGSSGDFWGAVDFRLVLRMLALFGLVFFMGRVVFVDGGVGLVVRVVG